jgi:transcriptional regulator GlxA family with amidase domain
LERALEDVRGNFAEALSAAQVARRWGFSPSDFSRMVRRATGRSFPAYRESLRVEHAKRLLLSSTLPASQVAVECGFRTAAYFGRIFKRAVGMTPDQYRRA